MRLFIAILLADPVRDHLTQTQMRLQAVGNDVKWVEPDSLHLTIHFLGDLPGSQLPDVQNACAQITTDRPQPFRVGLGGVSVFPKRGLQTGGPNIRTIFADVTNGATQWRTLAQAAQEAFAPFGVPAQHDLVPHITLGRVRSEAGMGQLRTAIAAESQDSGPVQDVGEIALVQSFLGGERVRHEVVCRFNLGQQTGETSPHAL